MKIDFKSEKYTKTLKMLLKALPVLGVVIFMIAFITLSFMSLFPRNDEATVLEGDKRVSSLEIKFNTKTFNELNSPVVPGAPAGGRNPFGN